MPLGVDLGTTNSSVAWVDRDGAVYSLPVRSGKEPFDAVLRTIVLDPTSDQPVVGQRAFEAQLQRPGAPLLASFKPKLDKQRLRQRVVRYEHHATGEYDFVDQGVRFKTRAVVVPLEYDRHSHEEVVAATACVLRRLFMSDREPRDPAIQRESQGRGVLDRFLSDLEASSRSRSRKRGTVSPDDFVYIGVPVVSGPTARKRLLAALAQTGLFGAGAQSYARVLERCRFVYEPLALASTLRLLDPRETVLVFDYGGGTLDLALLDMSFDEAGQGVRELALGGLPQAGDHVDELFREHLLAHDRGLRRAYQNELGSGSDYDRVRANNYFSIAKIDLSATESTVLRMPGFEREVLRAEFEMAIEPALAEVTAAVENCLQRGGVSAHEVGHVLLTGGSSLIPALQKRIRAIFAHLDDTRFVAGRPGDPESEREALTGVSRGLANYGFISQFFENVSPCDYVVWAGGRDFTPCLRRGDAAAQSLDKAPRVRVPVSGERRVSFAVYGDLVRQTFVGALGDIALPPGVDEVEVRIAASRRRFVPAFAVYDPRTRKRLAVFDLEALSPDTLRAFIEGDREWLPEGDHLVSAFLTRPLQAGDFVEWQTNGRHRRGTIVGMRDVNRNEHVSSMGGFDPEPYRVEIAIEHAGGVVHFGHRMLCDWRMGDVRLL
jgi:hypothetical protein